ncbi:MAG: type IV toxin-antitoxin system AbiEi family antitoxin [Planctomycetia bacterium]|jgi:predicted transcriptional regulator of viral defense system
MHRLEDFIDRQLAHGRGFFPKPAAVAELRQSPAAVQFAIARLVKKGRLVAPRRGFYLILRPEERGLGAPDPARWIDPLMSHLGLGYRISLLRAAAFHGAAHQAAMVFQVITPRQLPPITIGRQRVEFLYQAPKAFAALNRPEWLNRLKTDAGFATVAGVELTLLDICRYFHRAGGINGAAQAVHDLGGKTRSKTLVAAAPAYDNTAVRRLGYLLERFGYTRQARALRPIATKAKCFVPLDPSTKPLTRTLAPREERSLTWRLLVNIDVEIDE